MIQDWTPFSWKEIGILMLSFIGIFCMVSLLGHGLRGKKKDR